MRLEKKTKKCKNRIFHHHGISHSLEHIVKKSNNSAK